MRRKKQNGSARFREPRIGFVDQAITTLTGLLEVDESATFAEIRQVILDQSEVPAVRDRIYGSTS